MSYVHLIGCGCFICERGDDPYEDLDEEIDETEGSQEAPEHDTGVTNMPRKVRIEIDLDTIHLDIADSVRAVLHAHGCTIAYASGAPLDDVTRENIIAEIGRNASAPIALSEPENP